jgi:hypothetical protein
VLLRKKLALLLAAAMMVVVMMATTSTPAFAGPKSENSCGKANPQFPAQSGQDLDRCGVDNNPNSPDKPEGQPFQD